jgi:hypothetical protein
MCKTDYEAVLNLSDVRTVKTGQKLRAKLGYIKDVNKILKLCLT